MRSCKGVLKVTKVNFLAIIPAPSQNTVAQMEKGASKDLMRRHRKIPALADKYLMKT
jgi:hypothetical protein